MKHGVSLERSQIVEDFIRRLMNGVERETDGQVNISGYTSKKRQYHLSVNSSYIFIFP